MKMTEPAAALTPENQDAPYKGTWDLRVGRFHTLVITLDDLFFLFDGHPLGASRDSQLDNLMALPAWSAAPDLLKREVTEYLASR